MLIYEKDNKLNINFENSVNESPDLQIGKSGDKTEVLIDGQPGSGSGGGVYYVTFTIENDIEWIPDKSIEEMAQAFNDGKYLVAIVMMNGILPRYCPLSTFGNDFPTFSGVTENKQFIGVEYDPESGKWNIITEVLVTR
jgi:hypothetical protein